MEQLNKTILYKWKDGESPVDILRDIVASGVEYPEAEWKVINTLKLNKKAIKEMADSYLNKSNG